MPPEYVEEKEIDKRIFQEHRKLQGMTKLNAKVSFVQLCRSLKTYGVTFFLVQVHFSPSSSLFFFPPLPKPQAPNIKTEQQEKVPKKNKMVKILLGVTRESVMRLDAESKEVLKVWSLTTLRRWAASPNRSPPTPKKTTNNNKQRLLIACSPFFFFLSFSLNQFDPRFR